MAENVVRLNTYQSSNYSLAAIPRAYISDTRTKGYCTIIYQYRNGTTKAFELDFRIGKYEEVADTEKYCIDDMLQINYLAAVSLIKVDIKLQVQESLKAKEASLYDHVTNILFDADDKNTDKLPIKISNLNQMKEVLEHIIIYSDYGLLYEIASENILAKAENKHLFIYQIKKYLGKQRILAKSIFLGLPMEITNELGKKVWAGYGSWEVYNEEGIHCKVVGYYELIKING